MAEEPIAFVRAGTGSPARIDESSRFAGAGRAAAAVHFDRRELNGILNVYGRMVAAGEWRDYALDFLDDRAVFSIFRRTSEIPMFRVEKHPKLRSRQGMYAVIAAGGHVLKRGHELAQVLRVFDKKLMKAVNSRG